MQGTLNCDQSFVLNYTAFISVILVYIADSDVLYCSYYSEILNYYSDIWRAVHLVHGHYKRRHARCLPVRHTGHCVCVCVCARARVRVRVRVRACVRARARVRASEHKPEELLLPVPPASLLRARATAALAGSAAAAAAVVGAAAIFVLVATAAAFKLVTAAVAVAAQAQRLASVACAATTVTGSGSVNGPRGDLLPLFTSTFREQNRKGAGPAASFHQIFWSRTTHHDSRVISIYDGYTY